MKKSEKFGKFSKFELSAEQTKKIKGGAYTCFDCKGNSVGSRNTIEKALAVCEAIIANGGCCAGCA